MGNKELRNYYDQRYGGGEKPGADTLLTSEYPPVDRFQACLYHFPRFFKGGTILELGAGNGNLARALMTMDLGCESYTVTEFSEKRLEQVSENLADPRFRIKSLDVEDVPSSETERYDAVIMVALIEHVIDPIRVMKQVHSFVKPGGFVYIDTPNIGKYTRRLKLLGGRFPSTSAKREGLTGNDGNPVDFLDGGHLHYFTYRSLHLLLTEHGGFRGVKKLAYQSGRAFLGKRVHHWLATGWPELFSEIALIAYAD